MRTFLFEIQVNQSLINSGLTIPAKVAGDLLKAIDVQLLKGEKKQIHVLLNGKTYDTSISYANEKNSPRIIHRILYSTSSELCNGLRDAFKASLPEIEKRVAEKEGRKTIRTDEILQVYAIGPQTLEFVCCAAPGERLAALLKYIGPENSLSGYNKSYKLVLYKVFFEHMLKSGSLSENETAKLFRQFYIARKKKGLQPDKNADDVIMNPENHDLNAMLSLILRNPFNAIQKAGFMGEIKKNGEMYFTLDPELQAELTLEAKEKILDLVDRKLKYYYLKQLGETPENLAEPEESHSWLLTWNPKNYEWDELPDDAAQTQKAEPVSSTWSCSNGNVKPGDRVYVIMLGTNQNGIMASGYATSATYSTEHWNEAKSAAGIKEKAIDVDFDLILNPETQSERVLMQKYLKETYPDQHWSPQGSGILIKPEVAEKLEADWQALQEGAEPEVEIDEEPVMTLTTKEALDRVKAYISARGFDYPSGMIDNFYLSLKSKPFVILAGTSGTGKTRLVRLFAEAIGAEQLTVPVRPDWSDSSDLFGHTDLSGKFISGAVIDFICAAQQNPNRPYFLCLDEMNLARVEYYLSDILSVIETREWEAGRITSDPLVKTDAYGRDDTAKAKYGELRFPQNLYLVGTVNMDETTFPFSKKVLDRANTIEFSFVDLRAKPWSDEQPEALSLPNSFLCSKYLLLKDVADDDGSVEALCDQLQDLNTILYKANLHVGYRVRDEICFYMSNNKADELLPEDEALDNEILQKILPRVQGSSATVRDMLCSLFDELAGNHNEESGNSDADKMDKYLQNNAVKYPKSAAKIAMMVRRFEEDGFTSYWL